MRSGISAGNSAALRILPSIGAAVAAAARGAWHLAVAWRNRRQLLRIVDYDDHLLADIGLSRRDLHAALSTPCWQDPTARLVRRIAPALLMMMVLGAAPAGAAELRLLSAAAMQTVFKQISGDFERSSGHRLIISYATVGGVGERLERGEAADFVIGSSLSMPVLVKHGKIAAGSEVTICTTGIGVVVPTGTPVPALISVEDFKRAVLDAKVVVYADPVRGGAAGIHVARVFQQLDIADRLKSQITLAAGGDITEVTLAQGKGSLGITQVSEIVQKPGAQYVGPLPDALQNDTVFVGGMPAGAPPSDAVAALVAFLNGPIARAAVKAKGMHVDD
jgi:molybdate transport system substrate-binding protein